MARKKVQENSLQGWSDIIMNSGKSDYSKLTDYLVREPSAEQIAAEKQRQAKERYRLAYRLLEQLLNDGEINHDMTVLQLVESLAVKGM
jgi:hypothetical protein